MKENVFELESKTSIDRTSSFIISYPHLVGYFRRRNPLGADGLICGSFMVYGWMPTILKSISNETDLNELAVVLDDIRRRAEISDQELQLVTSVTNNSLVGASKLLHFLAPSNFAIWDSRVYAFLRDAYPHNYQIQKLTGYRSYLKCLEDLVSHDEFPAFHASVNEKMGYEVTPFRALEVVMFLNAPPRKTNLPK